MNNIEAELKSFGIALAKTEGISMTPMLCTGDTVVISTPTFPLKVGDIPVYRRCDHLTMHRIIFSCNHRYLISGDNLETIERDITDSDIIGVLIGFYRGDKYVDITDDDYIKYSKKMCNKVYKKVFKYTLKKIKKYFRGDKK